MSDVTINITLPNDSADRRKLLLKLIDALGQENGMYDIYKYINKYILGFAGDWSRDGDYWYFNPDVNKFPLTPRTFKLVYHILFERRAFDDEAIIEEYAKELVQSHLVPLLDFMRHILRDKDWCDDHVGQRIVAGVLLALWERAFMQVRTDDLEIVINRDPDYKPVFDPAVQLWRIIHSDNLNHTEDHFHYMSECNGKVTVQIGDEKFEYSSWRDAVKAVEDTSWYLSKEDVCDIATCASGFDLFPLGAWSFNQNDDDTVTFDPRERISFSDFAEFNNLMHGRDCSIRNVESEKLKDVMHRMHIEQLTDTIKTVLKGVVDAMRVGRRCTFLKMNGKVDYCDEDPSKYVE